MASVRFAARRRRLYRWLPHGMARLRLPGVGAAVGLCDGGSERAEGRGGAGYSGGGAGGRDRLALTTSICIVLKMQTGVGLF